MVRRYGSTVTSTGGRWRLAAAEGVDFSTEYKDEQTEILRRYDFGEDEDIWVDFTPLRSDPASPTAHVEITNTIESDTVLVFIDLLSLADWGPGNRWRQISTRASTRLNSSRSISNPLRTTIDVTSDMLWKIIHNPPAGGKDVRRSMTGTTGALKLGGSGPLRTRPTMTSPRVMRGCRTSTPS